ncbi:unnamed protein product [Periconia digitata]|uniref:Uncharacterized protein n=1 Tax=Periconia digitata TaxID=1303443 RepID=A0A9W4UDF7_9PLEO|nr:unnamed protein product [Periconia digitata]
MLKQSFFNCPKAMRRDALTPPNKQARKETSSLMSIHRHPSHRVLSQILGPDKLTKRAYIIPNKYTSASTLS